jgi:hypothetical protein
MAMRYPGGFISSTAPTVNANTAKGVWTLEEAMQYIRAGQWPVPTGNGDPYFQYNTMLLPGQGTNGAQNNTFLDSSTNNFTITRNGNTTQGTFTPFSGTEGNWSNFFDGSNDQLTVPSNAALGMSTGDFTIELWYYQLSRGSGNTLLAPSTDNLNIYITTAGLLGYYNGSTQDTALTVPLNQWGHIAVVRSSGTLKIYYNGAQVLSQANSINYGTASWYIGTNPAGIGASNGFMSNVRIVKGTAVYTSAFTPPTSPLTAISNTQLLTCQSNRFVDNSTNAFAITANNGVAVTPFQPFGAPTVAYSASTIGGSGYFDGTGDFLSWLSGSSVAFGSGDFTVETWFYTSSISGSPYFVDARDASNTGTWAFHINNSTSIIWFNGSSAWTVSATFPLNQWNHIAYVRSGTTGALYLNGSRVSTQTDSTNYSVTPTTSYVGARHTNVDNFLGYLSGTRIVKGTAVYSGTTYTVPTAPLTAITNTSLLLNFTNAGIIDNAQDNNLETVGDAKISTTQFKWGASSMYFDGSDKLTLPYSSNFNLGTTYTIEGWIYPTSVSGYQRIFDIVNSATSSPAFLDIALNGTALVSELRTTNGGGVTTISGGTVSANTWSYVALSVTLGSAKLYLNGNQVGSTTTFSALPDQNFVGVGGIGNSLTIDYFTGYIADLRVTKGYSRYPYNFTAPTAAFPLFWQAAATPSSDPYFDYTTLLLPGNGTVGAQNNTFLDSGTANGGVGFPINRSGNTTQGTFTPFSQTGWGNFFDGTGDYLVTPSSSALAMGSGDITAECWFYSTSSAQDNWLFDFRTSGSESTTRIYAYVSSNVLKVGFGALDDQSSGTIVLNAWNHVAIVRSGSGVNNVGVFLNGARTNQLSQTTNFSTNTQVNIGRRYSVVSSDYMFGYISNLRVVKGTAVYDPSQTIVTIPTSPLTAITNTALLTCQSNRFVDNSTNAFAITRNGDTSVQAFSPFNPTAAYSTSTVGGSGYFDGTGDFLSAASNAAFNVGSNSFCVEFWVYTSGFPGGGVAAGLVSASYTTNFHVIGINTTEIRFFIANSSISSTTAINLNAWNHVACVRNGTTATIYINGTAAGTGTLSGTGANSALYVGTSSHATTETFTGYLSNVRFVNGSAVYTANFTPPTAPLTAITNTSLLLSGTNGGIIDNTAKNNLETVGGASISTTVSKFGGSSMYFDGTGDWLLMPAGDKFAFGTGDYTVEAWVYFTSITTTDLQIIFLSGSTGGNNFYFHVDGNQISVGTSAAFISNQATSFSTATWYHVAACRYSGTLRLFVNGVQIGSSVSDTTNWISAGSARIGANESGTQTVFGYINDHRVTKGIARYTQNFTPPTTAFLTL